MASVRAYANHRPGVHTLTATATQSDGSAVTANGNFEVVDLDIGGRRAKNIIIILLGDGMGAAHRTAARIMSHGYTQGMAKGRLAMDTFPVTGMVMTASLNSIVTDSAPGMSNYVTGNKGANNQEGVFPDDTTDAFDNPRVEYMSEYLHRTQGKALGIVTTADVFDATPAANAVHTSNRGAGTGIVDQYLDTIEFDRAVQVAKEFAEGNPDTLVIVTADHECSGAAIIGASTVTNAALVAAGGTGTTGLRNALVGVYDAAGFPRYSINADGYPATTEIDRKMLIGYGANADRYEDWVVNATPLQDSQQPLVGQPPLNSYPKDPINRDVTTGFLVTGQVGGATAVHTATRDNYAPNDR